MFDKTACNPHKGPHCDEHIVLVVCERRRPTQHYRSTLRALSAVSVKTNRLQSDVRTHIAAINRDGTIKAIVLKRLICNAVIITAPMKKKF